jgi:RNA polymerase sigma factor (sigma-70 family)
MDFKAIYDEHKRMVYNLSLHYVWSKEDAEEITQDVFMSIFKGLNQFRNDSQLRTWIYRITINASIDFLKSKKRKKRGGGWKPLFIDSPNWNDKEVMPFAHPGFDMVEKEKVERIMRWIFLLPSLQRDVIVLTKLEGLSQREAAEVLGISVKAVENFIFKAKKNIQEKLDQQKES